jgi:hypothetical protein
MNHLAAVGKEQDLVPQGVLADVPGTTGMGTGGRVERERQRLIGGPRTGGRFRQFGPPGGWRTGCCGDNIPGPLARVRLGAVAQAPQAKEAASELPGFTPARRFRA